MTEYDYSEEGYRRFQQTQNRIANWVDKTEQHAPQFKSPFVPRSDVDNAFYNQPQPQHSSRRTPQRTYSYDYASRSLGSSPLRSGSHDLVSPRDSVSQMGGGGGSFTPPRHRSSHHRSSSHSPSRHGSSSHRSSSHHYRSPTHRATAPATYVVPQSAPVMQQYAPAPAYVILPRGKQVQIVTPQYTTHYTAAPEEHRGSLLQRIFGSQSGKNGGSSSRSRSLGHDSRSSSRSRSSRR
ncbi:hypothetical protein C8J57DRAFT_1336951 [Mycena rebaudengoi]|nr:hypothetical protein C8J57DRAFT_1336951 [Mycena rebaudengoi]